MSTKGPASLPLGLPPRAPLCIALDVAKGEIFARRSRFLTPGARDEKKERDGQPPALVFFQSDRGHVLSACLDRLWAYEPHMSMKYQSLPTATIRKSEAALSTGNDFGWLTRRFHKTFSIDAAPMPSGDSQSLLIGSMPVATVRDGSRRNTRKTKANQIRPFFLERSVGGLQRSRVSQHRLNGHPLSNSCVRLRGAVSKKKAAPQGLLSQGAARGPNMAKVPDDSPQSKNGASLTATIQLSSEALTFVAAPPETLSQRNVEAVTGIPARNYLEAIRAPDFPLEVSRLGKLRIVDRASFVTWLRTPRNLPPLDVAAPANDASGARNVDDVAGELGFERSRRAR